MSLKITCQNNPKHKRFTTTAHEMHDWVVDNDGNFVRDLGYIQTTHGPTKGNNFTCRTCGSDVIVEEV